MGINRIANATRGKISAADVGSLPVAGCSRLESLAQRVQATIKVSK
jgi:hypothetical protein